MREALEETQPTPVKATKKKAKKAKAIKPAVLRQKVIDYAKIHAKQAALDVSIADITAQLDIILQEMASEEDDISVLLLAA